MAKAKLLYAGDLTRVRDMARLALCFESTACLATAIGVCVRIFGPDARNESDHGACDADVELSVREIVDRFRRPTALGWRDVVVIVVGAGSVHICSYTGFYAYGRMLQPGS